MFVQSGHPIFSTVEINSEIAEGTFEPRTERFQGPVDQPLLIPCRNPRKYLSEGVIVGQGTLTEEFGLRIYCQIIRDGYHLGKQSVGITGGTRLKVCEHAETGERKFGHPRALFRTSQIRH